MTGLPEPDDAGCEAVPADLVELHEVLEWQAELAHQAEVQRTTTPTEDT